MRHVSHRVVVLALLLAGFLPAPAKADVVLLLAEPYGRSGGMNPSGHVGVYLTRVCAETPTVLRRCRDGESGVVISRYNRAGDFDWAAIPLIPYLYAVERAEDAPAEATPQQVASRREAYRRAHLLDIVPDTDAGEAPSHKWQQLIGASYDRNIVALSIRTTPEQDDEFISEMNARENQPRFNLFLRNCADFARDVVNRYHPRAIRGSSIADLGLTTPKQIAKKFVGFGSRRADLELTAYLIPQIPGSRSDSGRARGVMESLVKSKKYVVPLAIVQPWVPVGLAAGYLASGRFNPHSHVTDTFEPVEIERRAQRAGFTYEATAGEQAQPSD